MQLLARATMQRGQLDEVERERPILLIMGTNLKAAAALNIGRPCTICHSADRASIESAVVAGKSISRISQLYAVGADSLSRHLRNHIAPELRDSMRGSEGLTILSILEELQEMADQEREIHAAASASNNGVLALQALNARKRTLAQIKDLTGIDHIETLALLRDGNRLAAAVGQLVRSHPEAREQLLAILNKRGSSELAGQLAAISKNSTQKEVSE